MKTNKQLIKLKNTQQIIHYFFRHVKLVSHEITYNYFKLKNNEFIEIVQKLHIIS